MAVKISLILYNLQVDAFKFKRFADYKFLLAIMVNLLRTIQDSTKTCLSYSNEILYINKAISKKLKWL